MRTAKDIKAGDENQIIGYYVMEKFYSPQFPDGNESLLPDEGVLINNSY